MTTREKIGERNAINKKRAIALLPPIEDLKILNTSWEILARHLYEIICDEAPRLNHEFIEKIKSIAQKKEVRPRGQISKQTPLSVKNSLAKYGHDIKVIHGYKTNIEAATHIANIFSLDSATSNEKKKFAANISKRMSTLKKTRKRY